MSIFTEQRLVFIIFIVTCIAIGLRIQTGHNWGGDFSLYIAQSQAMIDGSLDQLLEANKFTVDMSTRKIGPYLVPPGFPTLLMPVLYFFGMSFVFLKAYCSLFFLGSIGIIYLLFRNRFENPWYAIPLLAAVAFSKGFLIYIDSVISDFPFLFFCFSCLYILDKRPSFSWGIGLGLMIFCSFSIRHVGIALIPTVLIYQLMRLINNRRQFISELKFHIIPHLLFVVLVVASAEQQWLGHPKQVDISLEVLTKAIPKNLSVYHKQFGKYLFGNLSVSIPWIKAIVTVLMLLIGSVGIRKSAQKWPAAFVFTLVMLGIIIIWPQRNGLRYMLPIIPFLLYYLMLGMIELDKLLGGKPVLHVVFGFLLLNLTFLGIKSSGGEFRRDSNTSLSIEMQKHYDYIKAEIPEREVIGFFKPRVLRLFTGRNCITARHDDFRGTVADYALLPSESNVDYGTARFSTKNFVLYELKRN